MPLAVREGAREVLDRDEAQLVVPPRAVAEAFEREAPADAAEALYSHLGSFTNCAGLEECSQAAREQPDRIEQEAFVDVFDTEEGVTAFLGESLVLSKLALFSKQEGDDSWKHRLVVDLLRPLVNSHLAR